MKKYNQKGEVSHMPHLLQRSLHISRVLSIAGTYVIELIGYWLSVLRIWCFIIYLMMLAISGASVTYPIFGVKKWGKCDTQGYFGDPDE